MPPSPLGQRDGGDAALTGLGPMLEGAAGLPAATQSRPRTLLKSPSTRPRGMASTGITPVSAPNGSRTTAEADDCDISELPSNLTAAIGPTASGCHGEKLIFF